MSHYDYIVIGAGIEGSWTALKLIQTHPKAKVLMLDQFKLPHTKGSSHGETRIIRHAYSKICYAKIMPMCYEDWKTFEKDVGEKLLIPNKPLLLYTDEFGYEILDKFVECLRELFPDDNGVHYRELSASELAQEFPQVKLTEKHRGCVDLTSAILLADKCLAAVQKRFVELGGEIWDGTPVTSLVPGSRVKVNTKVKGQLTADKVAVCAGPWTEKLLQPIVNKKLPLTTIRIPVHYWRIKDSGPGYINASFIDLKGNMSTEFWGLHQYEYPGLVKLSKSSIDVINPDDKDLLKSEDLNYTEISDYITKYFPGLDASKPEISSTCLYTWCRWELRMAQHRIFEGNSADAVIFIELERLNRDTLPLGLRVIMSTRTYLDWPEESSKYQTFWSRLREFLGTPIQVSAMALKTLEEIKADY